MGSDALAASTLEVDAEVRAPGDGTARLDARFSVPSGITALCGPSGAGKSTCLSAIAGLVHLARGRITLGGEVLADAGARLHRPVHTRRVGMVFQSLALFPHLTVDQNVAYGLPQGLLAAERAARVGRWLERMKVPHLSGRRPATLSGGEAQRVALARALASEPLALLLDEPFSALDGALRRALGEELRGLVASLRLPTLLVTHDRDDARALGARVVLLESGRVAAQGTPAEVLRAPAPG